MRSAIFRALALFLLSSPAFAAITYVGGDEDADGANTNTLTPILPTHIANDFCIVHAMNHDTGTDPVLALTVATGWTAIAASPYLHTNGTDRVNYLWYKKLTSDSETSPVITTDTSLAHAVTLNCFRGVDTTTAFDAAAVLTVTDVLNTAQPTSPAITTQTASAAILILEAIVGGSATIDAVAPTNYTLAALIDTDSTPSVPNANGYAISAYDLDVGAVAGEDPGAWGQTAGAGTEDSSVFTIALRPGADLPAFDSAPAFASCTDTGCTFDYDGGAVADNIQCMFLSTAESTPTAAAIEAQTGSNGYATEAVTGAADSITVTATDAPEFPRYNVHCALENGTSEYSAVASVANNAIADPTGEQFIAITSVGVGSPCESFNTAVNPDIANGDFLLANDNVDPGAVAVTISAACQYSYSASGRQSVLNTEVYDASVGAYHASDIDAWFNNSAPLCVNISEPFVWTKDIAIDAFDLDTYCTDADTEQSVYTVTTGTLPTGVTLTGATGAIAGTPTVEDEDGVAITFTATDIPGDTDTFTSTMYVIETVTMPTLDDDDLNTAIADMNTLRPWLDFGEGISVTFSCDVEELEQVVSQDPAASTEITATEEISLVVSLGACATSKRTSEMQLKGIRIGL